MQNSGLHSTRCAICGTEDNAIELYKANFNEKAFNPTLFSARRLPDRIRYRIVKCKSCGLLRSDPVADTENLAALYAQSSFNYSDELTNLKSTYGRYLKKLTEFGASKEALLEIGCGNGFFLEEAQAQGYLKVRGVEPSGDAVASASSNMRQYITCDILRPGLFAAEEFNVICMFQIFDHIPEPENFLKECLRILRPGGLILCLNHNVEAVSAKLLKSHSPIIDIEHTYLYSPGTLGLIFKKLGFRIRHTGNVFNRYSLRYLARLMPCPRLIKNNFVNLLGENKFGRLGLNLPLGNFYLIAQKPMPKEKKNLGFESFNRDIALHQGYLYTTNARLSSLLANQRLTEVALSAINFSGKKILDVGCGDGTYTLELFDLGKPQSISGIDPAVEAINLAQKKVAGRKIKFSVDNSSVLPFADKSFDIVHLRGALHHMDQPQEALREARRVGKALILIEPNGYNPILKILEKFSSYHRRHSEKSFTPHKMERWINQSGAKVYSRSYAGLVPFFCPEWLVKILKFMEPVVERIPRLNALVCAVYIFVIKAEG